MKMRRATESGTREWGPAAAARRAGVLALLFACGLGHTIAAHAITCPPCMREDIECVGFSCRPVCVLDVGRVCRPAAGPCDVAEVCTQEGPFASCPADRKVSAGTVCRAAAGVCDAAEVCDGAASNCPADTMKPSGTPCRAASGLCDVAETCSGTTPACPADGFAAAGTVCRAATDVCDVADTCSGTSTVCPNGFAGAGTVCRPAAGACDVAETCSGTAAACPANRVQPPGVVCRDAAGACDLAETCSGFSSACPTDAAAAAGTPCEDDADACTVDACDAAGSCVHAPAPDGDDDGTCDVLDPCTNPAGRDFVAGSKLAFTRIDADPTAGNDGVTLSGSFDLAPGRTFTDLWPEAHGTRLFVAGRDGAVLVDVALPGGAYAGKGTRGWVRAGSGKTWTWLDKTEAPLAGIVKLQLADKAKPATPQRTKVVMAGKRGTYAVRVDDAPLAVTLVLGESADGLCAEAQWDEAACTRNAARTVVTCRD